MAMSTIFNPQVALPPGSPDAASQLLGTPLLAAAGSPLGAPPIGAATFAGDLTADAAGMGSPMQNPAVAATAAASAAGARPRTASPGPLHNSPLSKAHAPGGAPLTGHARQVTNLLHSPQLRSQLCQDMSPSCLYMPELTETAAAAWQKAKLRGNIALRAGKG